VLYNTTTRAKAMIILNWNMINASRRRKW